MYKKGHQDKKISDLSVKSLGPCQKAPQLVRAGDPQPNLKAPSFATPATRVFTKTRQCKAALGRVLNREARGSYFDSATQW